MFEVGFGKIDLQKMEIKDPDQFGRSPLVIFNAQKMEISSGDLGDKDQRSQSLPISVPWEQQGDLIFTLWPSL